MEITSFQNHATHLRMITRSLDKLVISFALFKSAKSGLKLFASSSPAYGELGYKTNGPAGNKVKQLKMVKQHFFFEMELYHKCLWRLYRCLSSKFQGKRIVNSIFWPDFTKKTFSCRYGFNRKKNLNSYSKLGACF